MSIKQWIADRKKKAASEKKTDTYKEKPEISFSLPNTASEPVRRTWCCGYLQGNCEFVIRETPSDCVMKCGHGGITRNVWEMPDCPMDFWIRDSKGMPISHLIDVL